MFFLFIYVLRLDIRENKKIRSISSYIYLFHPIFIIIIRGVSKITRLSFLVENSLVFYLFVTISSFIFSIVLQELRIYLRKERKNGNFRRNQIS